MVIAVKDQKGKTTEVGKETYDRSSDPTLCWWVQHNWVPPGEQKGQNHTVFWGFLHPARMTINSDGRGQELLALALEGPTPT